MPCIGPMVPGRFKLSLAIALTCAAASTALPAAAQTTTPAPGLTLARLDCGTPVLNIVARFNGTWAFTDKVK